MKRPIICILVFLCFGIITSLIFENIGAIILISIGLFLFNVYLVIKYRSKYIFLIYLMYIIGFFLTINSQNFDETKINNTYELNGIVLDKQEGKYYNNLTVKVFSENNYKISLITNDYDVNVSDIISFESVLSEIDNNKNIGEFNNYYNSKSKGIDFIAYSNDITYIDTAKNIKYYSTKISDRIEAVFNQTLPFTEAQIVNALILGDKEFLDKDISDLYKKAGIYHILALSGMHISILSAFVLFILNFIFKDNKKNIFTILFLIFYLILTGSSTSTTRAVIMASVILLAPLFKRDYDIISSICFCAILMLVVSPLTLFTPSFILSFSSVLSIVLLSEKISLKLTKFTIKSDNKLLLFLNSNRIRYISPFISIYLVLNIFLVIYYYYFYPYSILVNIIISPFIAIVLILSFILGIVGLFSISLANILAPSVYYILLFFEFIAKISLKLPFNEILIGRPSNFFILSYFLILISVFYLKNKTKIITLTIAFCLMIIPNFINFVEISILNNDNNSVIIKNNELVLLDTMTKNTNNTANYILSKGYDKVSVIVTNSTDNLMNLKNMEMIENVYILENNPLINELEEKEISFNIVKEGEKFIIDELEYYIMFDNVYMQNKNLSFSNITNDEMIIPTNIQNKTVNLQDYYEYDIIVNNEKIIPKNSENIYIYSFRNKILIR